MSEQLSIFGGGAGRKLCDCGHCGEPIYENLPHRCAGRTVVVQLTSLPGSEWEHIFGRPAPSDAGQGRSHTAEAA